MGQTGSAFETAASKNLTAGLGSHALHKAMFAAALAFFGLVGLLWHNQYLTTDGVVPLDPVA